MESKVLSLERENQNLKMATTMELQTIKEHLKHLQNDFIACKLTAFDSMVTRKQNEELQRQVQNLKNQLKLRDERGM